MNRWSSKTKYASSWEKARYEIASRRNKRELESLFHLYTLRKSITESNGP